MSLSARQKLIAKVGAAVVLIVAPAVAQFEGTVLGTYKDPIGIVTACMGHTGPELKMGQKFTREECEEFLADDLIKFNDVVDRCISVPLAAHQRAALISFAYNVGPGKQGVKDGLCVLKNGRQPQIRQRFNRGDYAGGCRALTEGWTSAAGKQLPGLVRRRATERAICEGRL